MNQYSTDGLSISYLNNLPALVARWQRTVEAPGLYHGYATILEAAAARTCRYWLVDIRFQPLVNQDNVAWMTHEFFPRMHARLGGVVYLAYLMAPHQLADVLRNTSIPLLTYFDALPYKLERFTDEQVALDWLLYCYQSDIVAGRV